MSDQDIENRLIGAVADTAQDPVAFTELAFEWNEKDLEGEYLRKWQGELLGYIGERLKNPETRYKPIRIAVGSGHGIGKSALIGIIVNWGMSTCPDCKVVITANTEPQLRTKTFPEIFKWFRRSITSHWFNVTASAIYSKDKDRDKTWRADAVTWSENNTEAFAGLHNKKRRIIVIYDEASAIADKVWDTTEGALTDEETEIIWIVFGNPTRNTGRFKECFTKFRHLWKCFQIDSRTVEGTNKAQLQEWVDTYGEDSDFVKVRVRGMFPAASLKQFISTDDVDKAFGKQLKEHEYAYAPKIITVDPAWEGDDFFEIGMRQGLAFFLKGSYPKNDNDVQMANIIARMEDEEKADAVFIDAGYGTGIASIGKSWGRNWRLVWFGESSSDPAYLNKRAEMWGAAKQWLKDGGAIPKNQELYQDLIGPETVSRTDGKIQLESKKDMKARGLPSPGKGDTLALSFAYPIAKKIGTGGNIGVGKAIMDYDPFNRD